MKTTVLLFLATTILILGSCKKGTFDPTSAEDAGLAMSMFEDLDKVVEDAAKQQVGLMKTSDSYEIMGHCVTSTIQWTNGNQFPATLTLDFGEVNCTGEDGRERRGIVRAVISGFYADPNTVVTITPDNYFVDDHRIEGRKTVSSQGRNAQGHLVFKVDIVNGLITTPDGAEIHWESTLTNAWVAGDTTESVLDDVHHINGFGSGVDRKGTSFTMSVTKTLEVHLDCRWIEAGEITLTPSGLPARILNYGTGGCDDVATVQVGIIKVTIHLK